MQQVVSYKIIFSDIKNSSCLSGELSYFFTTSLHHTYLCLFPLDFYLAYKSLLQSLSPKDRSFKRIYRPRFSGVRLQRTFTSRFAYFSLFLDALRLPSTRKAPSRLSVILNIYDIDYRKTHNARILRFIGSSFIVLRYWFNSC